MIRRLRRTAALLALSAVVFAACSEKAPSASDDPKAAFQAALDALAEYEGATLTFSIASDEASMAAASEGDLDAARVSMILNSSITVSAKQGETVEDSAAQFVVNIDGNDAVELRVVGDSLYARADARGLAETFGADTAMLDAAAQQAAAQGLAFVEPAVNGEWIGIEGLNQFAEQITGQPMQQPDSEEQAKVLEALTNVLKDNVTVTAEGSDDIGDHVVASVPLRETVEELVNVAQDIAQVPLGTEALDLSEVPDADLKLDAWINDGKLVQLELDFLQFAEIVPEADAPPEGVENLGLRVTIAEFSGEVEVPEPVTLIDPQQIFQMLMGGMSSGMTPPATSGGGTIPELGIACSDLQGLQPSDIKAFLKGAGRLDLYEATKQACPELF